MLTPDEERQLLDNIYTSIWKALDEGVPQVLVAEEVAHAFKMFEEAKDA